MYHQLIYRSRYRPTQTGVSATVREVIATSERNNGHYRITGYLIFDKTHFLQILEGDEAEVEQTFERICQDSRHDLVTVLARHTVDERAFSEWAMGGTVRGPEIEEIFRRHGVDQSLGEVTLSPNAMVALALDVSAWEAERKKTRGLSAR